MTRPNNAAIKRAIENAERVRKELPALIQPEQSARDMVTLVDYVYWLEDKIEGIYWDMAGEDA